MSIEDRVEANALQRSAMYLNGLGLTRVCGEPLPNSCFTIKRRDGKPHCFTFSPLSQVQWQGISHPSLYQADSESPTL